MKHLPAMLILVFAGCDASAPTSSESTHEPSSTHLQTPSEVERTPPTETLSQITPVPAIDGEVSLTLNVMELPGKRVTLNGTTNLPSGTKMMLSVQEKMENGFLGQSSCFVTSNGEFESETFGSKDGLKDGRYVAEVTMPVAALQSAAVKKVIGNTGEYLTGPLVKNGTFGITVSQQKEFAIGGMPDAAQAERKRQSDKDTASLKRQLCVYLEQLLQFKDDPQFKQYGFGIGGPYNKWLKAVEALRDALPKGSHQIPLLLRAAPSDLMMLGMDYMQKGETEHTRQLLSELKQTIDFKQYLALKN